MISKLFAHRVIVCVGSGGVGKTTVSASLGIRAAQLGKKVLVMTIDPSKRLKDALGLGETDGQIITVPNRKYSGRLDACVLNPEKIFYEFIHKAGSPEAADRLAKNRLYQQLSTTLSGSQEFTALLQLSKILDSHTYDLIILDTPPAQHAIEFLEAPEKISALFQEQVVQWFLGDTSEVGIVRKLIYRGTRMALGLLEKLTGSGFISELNDFFNSIKSIQKKIAEKSAASASLLRDSATCFLLVTGFDVVKLKEAEDLKLYLEEKSHHLAAVVINRDHPGWDRPANPALQLEYEKWDTYYRTRQESYDTYAKKWSLSLPVWRIPDFNNGLSGIQSLEEVAHVFES